MPSTHDPPPAKRFPDPDQDDVPTERIAALFQQGAVFTDAELLSLIHAHSLDELGLIVSAFQNEAFAFLLDPDLACLRALALAAAITRHLSDPDRTVFEAWASAAFKGHAEEDQDVLDRLPIFEYVRRGHRIAVEITFPDHD